MEMIVDNESGIDPDEAEMPDKRCPACGETKSIDRFHRDKCRPGGRASCCAECGRARSQSYYARHREERQGYARDYKRNNPDKVRDNETNRPAESKWVRVYRESCRKAGVEPIVVPFTKAEVIDRYGDKCSDCGSPSWELRHQIPVGAGGVHRLENVRPRCRPCGSSKIGRTDKAIIAVFRSGADDLKTSSEMP